MTIKTTKHVTPRFRKADGEATAEQLRAINQFTLAELGAEQVYVRTAILAHNAIDRDREVFDDVLLDDFARTLPGKGLFRSHPGGFMGDAGPGIGRWFAARTLTVSFDEARELLRDPSVKWAPGTERAKLLESSFYVPRTPKNEDLAADADAGVVSDVSIGFRASDRSPIQDGDGNTIAMRLLGPGEALEGSLVWLGAQPGARIHKDASRSEESEVEKDEQIKQANARAEKAEGRVTELEPKANGYEAIVKVLGEDLAKDPETLKRSVDEGKAFRADLIERIVKAERLAGLAKDDEASVKAAKELHQTSPVERLTAYLERVEKMAPEGGQGQITGSDPNRSGATNQKQTDPSNPFGNPAITGKAAA